MIDFMNLAMELNAESHKDYLHYKIMSKMVDSEITKQWFQLFAEEAFGKLGCDAK